MAVVPDPDVSTAGRSVPERDPRRLTAADQMCYVSGKGEPAGPDDVEALYNIDRCGSRLLTPNPDDPDDELRPKGLKQGEAQENDTVRE